jgi:hypothetical protein
MLYIRHKLYEYYHSRLRHILPEKGNVSWRQVSCGLMPATLSRFNTSLISCSMKVSVRTERSLEFDGRMNSELFSFNEYCSRKHRVCLDDKSGTFMTQKPDWNTRCSLCTLLSTWCRAAAFFSASGAALSQEIPTLKWMFNQPALWTLDMYIICNNFNESPITEQADLETPL